MQWRMRGEWIQVVFHIQHLRTNPLAPPAMEMFDARRGVTSHPVSSSQLSWNMRYSGAATVPWLDERRMSWLPGMKGYYLMRVNR